MRKPRYLAPLAVLLFVLTACLPLAKSALPLTEGQSLTQLRLSEGSEITAAWIPYFICDRLFASPNEIAARDAVRMYLTALQEKGINTVFVHVCAFGESTYPSAYYPKAPSANGIDEMQVFTEICADLGISLHAWLNPLRLQTEEYMEEQSGSSLLTRWYADPQTRAVNLSRWDKRYYLNPAMPAAAEFLSGAVRELIEAYHPDGIHIDDYFYPTTETAWDMNDFAASGQSDLAAWRRSNITALVREMYRAAHEADADTLFSISPQGNLSMNYDTLYADTALWARSGDCCDLLMPQLYFGYENQRCPFSETLAAWDALPRAAGVRLIPALAAYKVGETDEHAGSGADEWITQRGILARQAAEVLADPDAAGIAFYHADALLQLPVSEQTALRTVLSPQQAAALPE